MKLEFTKFLNEAPLGAPASLPPAPGGIGAPPMGGAMGGMPPALPMGGMGGMPPPPMGMGGPPMPGQPGQPGQQGPKELKQTDVWGVLEDLLGIKKTSNKSKDKVQSSDNKHLMS